MSKANIKSFFDKNSNTFSYVVSDPYTRKCAVIDSVLGFDLNSRTTFTYYVDQIIQYIHDEKLQLEWILETHVHADHITAAQYLKEELGGKIAMSAKISIVQETFSQIYNIDIKKINAQQPFDYLFKDGENFSIG